ncbi:helix-turn-helix domain-containing protein [Mucilaginibacter corticis]|uniref:Helix-turn-helix domain-containing protein n=1 Tax=Mucilaginibacter corticis TaxID=2597670 RepID=A0A556MUU4_9SPHI|nr:AraC family transcriptional regulator [Mucilaginibacter corticis]TSJ43711.1 helix-turn-helix domain-containing protein [Mucilaginibacter corticis]
MHQLKHRADNGLEMRYFSLGDEPKEIEPIGAHRDDHYLFFLLDSGSASLMIDFHELHFSGYRIYYILPGQVHHRISNKVAQGWYLAVDTALVPTEYRDVFEGRLLLQQPISLDKQQYEQANQLMHLLNEKFRESNEDPFQLQIAYSLMQAYAGLIAGYYCKENDDAAKASRSAELARQFKTLLADNLITHKSPSFYAGLMNVTEGYLNEVLKKITGFSVSNLIMNEVMLEAKRLLFYSTQNVKEIAHTLGYQDHTYFSRLFKNSQGVTPLEFRNKYLK